MPSMDRLAALALAILALHVASPTPTKAETPVDPFSVVDGSWNVLRSSHRFPVLVSRLDDAVKSNGMNVVNVASASEGAKAQGISIPGNRVVGVFRNDFARRMLKASIPAGIEAPLRFYLVETEDGLTILAYRRPSALFAPYVTHSGDELHRAAGELDVIFEKIASTAAAP